MILDPVNASTAAPCFSRFKLTRSTAVIDETIVRMRYHEFSFILTFETLGTHNPISTINMSGKIENEIRSKREICAELCKSTQDGGTVLFAFVSVS